MDKPNPDEYEKGLVGSFNFFGDALQWRIEEIEKDISTIKKRLDKLESSPPTKQEAEKASELRWACERWEREKKGVGVFLKHFGPVSDARGNHTELYVEARKWLEDFDKKLGFFNGHSDKH